MKEEFVHELDHPLAKAILTVLRDKRTGQIEFRKSLVRLGRIIGLEIVKFLDVEKAKVETPLNVVAEGITIPDMNNTVIISVLRAAMPLVEGLIKIFPNARQGVISARRVEEKGMRHDYSFEIEVTYHKIPEIKETDIVIIADPMFATGSTIIATLEHVLKRGTPKKIFVATAISTNIAIERLRKFLLSRGLLDRAKIITVAIDPMLNEHGYIVPGLGDAGDRAFGT
ncbi:MAG: uracil phosphoribosyltransferase [Sulfolobales archaeon]